MTIFPRWIRFVAACAIASLASCAPTQRPEGTPVQLTQLQWLQKQPCAAPCWEGIMPGETTATEAANLLKGHSLVDEASVQVTTSPLIPERGYVVWKWLGSDLEGQAKFDASSPEQTIYFIGVGFSTPFTMKDVVQTYGEPSHIMVIADHGTDINSEIMYDVKIVYLSQGFMLQNLNGPSTQKPEIREDMVFSTVVFFIPSQQGFLLGTGIDITLFNRSIVTWRGIEAFDYYCQQAYGANAVQCE